MTASLLVAALWFSWPIMADDQQYHCNLHQFCVLGDDDMLEMKVEGYEGEVCSVDRNANVITGNKLNTLDNVVANNPTGAGMYSLVNYRRKEKRSDSAPVVAHGAGLRRFETIRFIRRELHFY